MDKHFEICTEIDQLNCTLERNNRCEVYNIQWQIIPYIDNSLSEKPVTNSTSTICLAKLGSMTTSTNITELKQLVTGSIDLQRKRQMTDKMQNI